MKSFVIKSDFDCLVLLNGKELGLLDGGELYCKVDSNKFVLTFFPLDNQTLPYSCVINYESGKVNCSSKLCSVVELPMNNYELYFAPYIIKYKKPHQVANKNFETPIGKLDVRVFNNEYIGGVSQIQVVKNNEMLIDFQASSLISNVNIQSQYVSNEYFIFVSGLVQDYEYLLAISVNEIAVISLELIAHQVEIHEDCIKTLSKCFDIHKHGKVNVYKVKNGKFYKDEDYLVVMNENVSIQPDLIPYAFFEALKVGDIKKCREYLTSELNDSVDDEHLKSYFGDFEEVRQNVYTNDSSSVILVYRNDDNYISKICKLSMLGNNIDNFELLDA